MSFINAFTDMLTQECTVEHRTGEDAWGRPTYGAPVIWLCRAGRTRRAVYGAQGVEVVVSSTVTFLGVPNLGAEDRITLSDGSVPTITTVDSITDETGVIAQRANIGGARVF